MLCPEVNNFPPPKTTCTVRKNLNIEKTETIINLNNFYRSAIITFPDELNVPSFIQECFLDDSDYYKILNCPVVEFIDPVFIETFVRKGRLYCLSVNKSCITHNSVAITPDGILTLNITDYVYQTLGLEGIKRPHNFHEVRIDLKDIKRSEKLKNALSKLELFNFYISWEPHDENICPSTIAKYFSDKNYTLSQHALQAKNLSPEVTTIPSLIEIDIDEVVEWLGMLAHNANLTPEENYISAYYVPDSGTNLQSTRVAVLIIKGFMTPNIMNKACKAISEYVLTRELENYWAALSIQTVEESLYQWNFSSQRMFQSHNSSCNIFFTHNDQVIYSVGQLKYS
ncbi:ribonuclease P protein subunit p40-like [Colias croceus]|uniref:ribonuclease P protein subunit p40-like n=1 Tax=Colias crocea TaxID=72248 RepID=UPI001E27C896|nr:ribonuclease P protein subunit p40-like [Colias croceus]